jgi:hypothetical protein
MRPAHPNPGGSRPGAPTSPAPTVSAAPPGQPRSGRPLPRTAYPSRSSNREPAGSGAAADIPGPADCVTAMQAAEHTVYARDMLTDYHKQVDEHAEAVHRMTAKRMSANEIAVRLGISQRHVVRLRRKPQAVVEPGYDFPVDDQRAAELEDLAGFALQLAARLRDEDPALTWEALQRLSRQRLQQLVVILAAAVPVDSSPAQLFDWVTALPTAQAVSA